MTWFSVLLEILNGVLQQLTYFEGLEKSRQTPEEIYARNKSAMDEALAKNDSASVDLLTSNVLPPPQGSDNPK